MLGLSSGLIYEGFIGLTGWDPNYINDNTSHTCLMWYDFGLDGSTGSDDGTYWLNKTNASGGDRVTAKLNPHNSAGTSFAGAFVGAGSTGNAMSDQSFSSDELSICIVFTDEDDTWNEAATTLSSYSVPFEIRLMEQDASSRVWRYNIFKDYHNDSPGNTDPASWDGGTRPGKRIFHQWGQYASNTTSPYSTHGVTGDGGAINPPFTPLMSQNNTTPQWITYHAIDGNADIAGKLAFGDNFNSSRWSAVDSWWPAADGTNNPLDACMKGYDVSRTSGKWPYTIDFSVDDDDNKIIFNRLKPHALEIAEMPWEGIIHEIIMFKGDLYSDGTYQYLQNYLVNKYGGTGLYY